jgi:hypothetical protein
MTFDDYKFICFSNKISPELIESCRPFINQHQYLFNKLDRDENFTNAESDLGYAELEDINNKSQSIEVIKKAIFDSTLDFDKNGRSLIKVRTKQLIKDPGKHIRRLVLKSFYLYYYDL